MGRRISGGGAARKPGRRSAAGPGRRRRRSSRSKKSARSSTTSKRTTRKGGRGAAAGCGTRDWITAAAPKLSGKKHCYGIGVYVAVLRRQGDRLRSISTRMERVSKLPGERPMEQFLDQSDAATTARALAGLGHPVRLKIIRALAAGARSHADLERAVGLKPGPLYHHLRTLERGGLVTMAVRNVYELTRSGMVGTLVAGLACGMSGEGDGRWRDRETRI